MPRQPRRISKPQDLPDGFTYRPDFLSEPEEQVLVQEISRLDFGEVRMHGVIAKRRVAHFGWNYGYESWRITPGPPMPDFLLEARHRSAELIQAAPEDLAEVLVTEYPEGAGIGWHRDAPMFGTVAGISLHSACRFRLRRGEAGSRQARELELQPRSAYVLSGPARSEWQHSIPPTPHLRYSITFRTLKRRDRAVARPDESPSRPEARG